MSTRTRNHPEQLALFGRSAVPERFRLDDDTRRRGMRHVAELKARLEARYPSRHSAIASRERAA